MATERSLTCIQEQPHIIACGFFSGTNHNKPAYCLGYQSQNGNVPVCSICSNWAYSRTGWRD